MATKASQEEPSTSEDGGVCQPLLGDSAGRRGTYLVLLVYCGLGALLVADYAWGFVTLAGSSVLVRKTCLLLRNLIQNTMIGIYSKSCGFWIVETYLKFLSSSPADRACLGMFVPVLLRSAEVKRHHTAMGLWGRMAKPSHDWLRYTYYTSISVTVKELN